MSDKILRFAAVMVLLIAPLMAQSANTAALSGTVTDQSGAVVPNVTVVVTSISTNQGRTVTSGTDGVYRVPFLEPGNYKVRFTAQGFKTAEISSVNLPVTETVALDRSLE